MKQPMLGTKYFQTWLLPVTAIKVHLCCVVVLLNSYTCDKQSLRCMWRALIRELLNVGEYTDHGWNVIYQFMRVRGHILPLVTLVPVTKSQECIYQVFCVQLWLSYMHMWIQPTCTSSSMFSWYSFTFCWNSEISWLVGVFNLIRKCTINHKNFRYVCVCVYMYVVLIKVAMCTCMKHW